jgi:menaquinone-specific isochorismate synthase
MRRSTALAPVLVSRTRRLAQVGPPLDHLGAGGFAWLHEGAGFVTSGTVTTIPVEPGPDRFERAAADVARVLDSALIDDSIGVPGSQPIAVGALPFDEESPGTLVVPALVIGRAPDGTGWVTETAPEGSPWLRPGPSPRPRTPSRYLVQARSSRRAWDTAVDGVLAAIADRRAKKVVLARDIVVEADRALDPRSVLRRLVATHPSCFTFAAGHLVGATPELLIRRQHDHVVSRPVAGTAPAGDPDWLIDSPKEREEHALVVSAIVDALRPVCRTIGVEARPAVERLATLSHLMTTVEGRLHEPLPSALALAGLLHPTPAVAGVPRDEALQLIAALEGLDRGCYAGPVGWVDARGDGEWAVALRCAELNEGRARLFAGAGIVEGSDPDAEWEETQFKFEPVLQALVRL